MNDQAPNQADPFHSDEGTDQLVLAGVKRLIAERNALRSRLISREREAVRYVSLIRDSYQRLANELITQLELVDKFDSEVAPGTDAPTNGLITQLELVDKFDNEVAPGTDAPTEFPRFLGIVPPKASN
jgi:hypothetical protein